MTSLVTGLRLYDYTGQYNTARRLGTDSSFRTAQTDFGPSFTVNAPSNNINIERLTSQSFGVDRNYQLQATNPSNLQNLLSFGNNRFSSNSNLDFESVANPYENYISSLNITDQNFGQLLKQDEFRIFNGRVGIKVETDGNENIESVSLQPGSKELRTGAQTNIVFPDRTFITERAISREANALPSSETESDFDQIKSSISDKPKTQFDQSYLQTKSIMPPSKLNEINPFSQSEEAFRKFSPGLESSNDPVFQKLLSLQPLETGTRIFGPESQLTPEAARKLGTVNASFEVKYSDSFKDNITQLKDYLAQQANASLSYKAAQARDGYIPVSPFLPAESPVAKQSFFGGSFLENSNQLETMVNTTDKKSSGGSYVPFYNGGGNNSGSNNPQQRRKAPMRYIA